MPAQNPKHKKKQVQTLREQQYGGRKIPFRPILMVVIFVGVVFMIIFVIEYYQKIAPPIGEVIQDGDVVTLDYKLWADTSHTGNIATWYDGGNAAPINNATAWNTTVSNSSLIAGFYQELLGKSVGFSTIFTVPPSQAYTDPSSQLYNLTLIFWIKVDAIGPPAASTTTTTNNADHSFMTQIIYGLLARKIELA